MNLYVGNLSRNVTEADLEVIFHDLGHIVFARLAGTRDADDGYAFVYVHDERQAREVIGALNGKYLKGQRLVVRPVVRRRAGGTPPGRERRDAHLHLLKSS